MKTFDGVVDTDRVTRNECDLLLHLDASIQPFKQVSTGLGKNCDLLQRRLVAERNSLSTRESKVR